MATKKATAGVHAYEAKVGVMATRIDEVDGEDKAVVGEVCKVCGCLPDDDPRHKDVR
jgi:hypothetical protein